MSILDGYKMNGLGHLVPTALIDEIDLLRDDTVNRLLKSAHDLRRHTLEVKRVMYAEIKAFMQLSFERYQISWGGEKGNVTLTSYDKKYKISLTVATHLSFSEGLQAAKKLVDNCIVRWSQGADVKIQALVQHAFQTDKLGRINTGRVLQLTRLVIDDPEWKLAMKALLESLEPSGTSEYIRVMQRVGNTDRYEQVVLDFSSLPVGEQ